MILILIIVFLTRFYLGITGRGKGTLGEELREVLWQIIISIVITYILLGIQDALA